MTNPTGETYRIDVTSENGPNLGGYGDLKVLSYLSVQAVKALGAAPDGTEATVSVKRGDTALVSFTGDADTAAMVLKSKVSKERKASGVTEDAAEDNAAE